jgi:hypothetical protein
VDQIKLTVVIAGDGNVHVVYKDEQVWPIRSVMAKTFVWLIEDKFSTDHMTFIEDTSKVVFDNVKVY